MVTEKRFKRVVERLAEEIGKLQQNLWDVRQEIRKGTKINTKEEPSTNVGEDGEVYICRPEVPIAK